MDTQINTFIEYCQFEKCLDYKTLKAYSIDLKQFYSFTIEPTETKDLLLIFHSDISEYIKHLNKLYKPKTVKRKIATLKSFYSYSEYLSEDFQSPFRRIKLKIREPKQLPRTIKIEYIDALFKHLYKLKESTPPDTMKFFIILRDLLTIELLFISGVRVSELSNLKIEDISESFDTLQIIGKGKKERIIPIYTLTVTCLIKEYMQYRDSNNAYLLQNRTKKQFSAQSIRFMIRKYVKFLNIPIHITPHMFRHTVATLLLENELDIRYIQHLLGHSSISTTEIYTHVTAQSYKDQINTKHPRRLVMNGG